MFRYPTRVRCVDDRRIELTFDDGATGVVDIGQATKYEGIFAPLEEPEYFRLVRVDDELGTICWPNGADFDPDVLYSLATGRPLPDWAEPDDYDRKRGLA